MRPWVLVLAAAALSAETKLLVTVSEPRTGVPVTGLTAADLAVADGGAPRKVLDVQWKTTPVDWMLLVDSSAVGQQVQGIAADLIGQLRDKEQMALASYDSSAELVQDFTSSPQTLLRALSGVKYGNAPRVLDGLFAVLDGGFEHAVLRRVILLVTTGMDRGSRTDEKEVVRLARKNGVSIYPLYVSGSERGLFDYLARNTGGATVSIRDASKAGGKPAVRVADLVRSNYEVTLAGNLTPTDKMKIEVQRQGKFFTSALVLD